MKKFIYFLMFLSAFLIGYCITKAIEENVYFLIYAGLNAINLSLNISSLLIYGGEE